MGRGITHRVIVKGILTLDTSLHHGSGQASAQTDALLLRDTDGRILISGTSIGGALRSRLEKLIGVAAGHQQDINQENIEDCRCHICNLFGTAENASIIVVEDAYLNSPVEIAEYRDAVAISRDTQTARKGAKYDYETLPAGSIFDFELSVDLNDKNNKNDKFDEKDMKKILYIGLEELCNGRIHIGGSTTRGLGRCHLKIINIYTLNLQDTRCLIPLLIRDDLADISKEYVTGYDDYFGDVKDSLFFKNKPDSHTRLELDFDIILEEVEDLLVVKNGRYAFGDDPEIRFVRTKQWNNVDKDWKDVQFIPGGSIKGPLRNRAEQILRTTINTKYACDPTTKEGGCGTCAICKLFGFSKKAEGVKGQKGRLSLEDAYPAVEEIHEKKFDFVAIDRFTGGALDKAKFDARIASDGYFKSRIIIENPKLFELALVAHLLKDFYLKDIRLGYGKYKGFGRVKGILRQIRLLQTRESDGLIADLNLKDIFPETNGYWHRNSIWHIMTIPSDELCNGTSYKPLSEQGNFQEIIEKLDQAFNEFIEIGGDVE
ncbi:MAG: hypothetical protein K8R40_12505 [Anaerolineaceae bacterium]|nr:hypothetical protein [Anaerolineaceae bacterium]